MFFSELICAGLEIFILTVIILKITAFMGLTF